MNKSLSAVLTAAVAIMTSEPARSSELPAGRTARKKNRKKAEQKRRRLARKKNR